MSDGKLEVTTAQVRKGKILEETEGPVSEKVKIPVKVAGSDGPSPVFVEYGSGVTINMGNFESRRIDVKLVVPARMSTESIQTMYDFAKDFVDRRVEEETDKAMDSRK